MIEQIVAYKDRIDGFFSDKSILVSYGDSLQYYMNTGTKATIKINKLSSNQQAGDKLTQMLEKYNQYSDQSIFWKGMIEDIQYITKLKRIDSCIWSSKIEKTQKGYKLFSLDRSANIQLQNNNMLVKVEYLQQINQKCLLNNLQPQNTTRNLLTKYNLEYQEYPQPTKTTTIAYKYIKTTKIFPISQVPKRWHYPTILIWNYVVDNKIITNPVIEPCYLSKENSTVFPKFRSLQVESQTKLNLLSVPAFRYPHHSSSVIWMLDLSEKQVIGWVGFSPLCYDRQGFWILHNEAVHLKFHNSVDSQKIYNIHAIPMVVRAQNYERKIRQFLISLYNSSLNYGQQLNSQSVQEGEFPTIVSEQSKQLSKFRSEYGVFTVFSNHIVTGKFTDNLFIIANYLTGCIKIRDEQANTVETTFHDNFYAEYYKHLNEYYEAVYYPTQNKRRVKLNEQSLSLLSLNQSLISHIDSGDYKKQTYSESLQQNYDVANILRKNQQLLKKIQKYK